MSTTEDHEGELKVYEIGYSILPSIPEEKLADVVESIKQVVAKSGGNILDGEDPHLRPLAYEMRKIVGASKYVVNEAYFGWFKFETEASNTEAIKAGVEKVPEVLRSLLVKAPRETAFTFAQTLAKEREVVAETELVHNEAPAQEEKVVKPLPEVSVEEDVVE